MTKSLPKRVLFVQPFGLGSTGGGQRIFASMIKDQPFEKLSINADPYPGPGPDWIEERHVPIRPRLGRLDRGRFSKIGQWLEIPARPFFRRRLAQIIDAWHPDVVHVIPHWANDFHVAWSEARKRGCRVVLSVHDDLEYAIPVRHPLRGEALDQLGKVWGDADHIFVISQELGEEYNRRYGQRPFEIITDGLEVIADRPLAIVPNRLRVCFFGLFHYNYRENLRVLTQALAKHKALHPQIDIKLTLRCENLERGIDSAFPAHVLPFASQTAVLEDMRNADLLYLPLPFESAHEGLVRYSLSTKLVSYLGSGVPILFHGPSLSAASQLLERHQAALLCHSLDESELLKLFNLHGNNQTRAAVVENALQLAKLSFPLDELRRRFLSGLLG